MKRKSKILSEGIIIIFLLTVTAPFLSAEHFCKPVQEKIVLNFSFPQPTIKKIAIEDQIFDRVTIENLPNTHDFRYPCLPVKPIKILLPYGKRLERVEVITPEKTFLGNGYNLEIEGAVIPILATQNLIPIEHSTSRSIRKQKTGYSNLGVYTCRGFSILHINLYPVEYNPESGAIFYYKNIKVIVFTDEPSENKAFRGLPEDFAHVVKIIDNPSYVSTYKSESMNKNLQRYEYVIITNWRLKNAGEDYTFQDLVEYKESKGYSATIVTIEEILINPDYRVDGKWGDNNPNNPFYQNEITENLSRFDDKPARIRNFIRHVYKEWGTKYILLGGDADAIVEEDNIIPLRGLFANESGLPLDGSDNLAEEQDDIPSDVYYSCLDGNYNYDMDEHFGECGDRNDLKKIDEADLYAEVWVGRACVDSPEEVSNFVMKTLKYEQTDDPYISEILFVGEDLGPSFFTQWGGDYKDLIEHYVPQQYNVSKLYDRDFPNNRWVPQDFFDTLDSHPVQIINHDGHGNHNYMLKMSGETIKLLENQKHFFIYSHSCLTGSFDNWNCWSGYQETDCIAEILTCEIPYGAFACILNARYGLGSENSIESPSGAYDDSFYKALFIENIKEIGRANHYSKEDNIWRIDENGLRWCYYQTNLFGDPNLAIKDPANHPPLTPTLNGPTSGKIGVSYNYTITTEDPNSDKITYYIDWGDETNNIFIGPYNSGEVVTVPHKFPKKGSYTIKAKAIDSKGEESDWATLTVSMTKDKSAISFPLELIHQVKDALFKIKYVLLRLVFIPV